MGSSTSTVAPINEMKDVCKDTVATTVHHPKLSEEDMTQLEADLATVTVNTTPSSVTIVNNEVNPHTTVKGWFMNALAKFRK